MKTGMTKHLPFFAGIVSLMLCSGFIGFSEALSGEEELDEVAGYGMEKLSTVLVTGSVVCDACLTGNIAAHSHPLSGAVVCVVCQSGRKRKVIRARGVTDKYGDFIIDLPSDLHADPYLDRTCIVKVQKAPKNSLCHARFGMKNKSIELSSVGNGIREYTAGKIRLRKLKHTTTQDCTRGPTIGKHMEGYVSVVNAALWMALQ